MSDEQFNDLLSRLAKEYNPPPPAPREEMWVGIQARLGERPTAPEEGVVSLDSARASRFSVWRLGRGRPLAWATAAAALLILGVGIGRITAPASAPPPASVAESTEAPDLLHLAAVEHLARTESLLVLMQADARTGRLEPQIGEWAQDLLGETRLFLDTQAQADPVMKALFEDLELVLAQIVGAANARTDDDERVRSELTLAMEGIDMREVLPRIQALLPAEPGFAEN
jgi:hypothetical protein